MPAKSAKLRSDRRVVRTRARLGEALRTLMAERPLEQISVQDVIELARVSRSTFYAHYDDKVDLLLSDMDEFLERMAMLLFVRNESSNRIAPVRELFAHVSESVEIRAALARSERLHDFFDLAQGYFARGIEQRLKESKRLSNLTQRELAARSSALAGSLLSMLRWWLDRGEKEPPRAMDELFHRMVWIGLQ